MEISSHGNFFAWNGITNQKSDINLKMAYKIKNQRPKLHLLIGKRDLTYFTLERFFDGMNATVSLTVLFPEKFHLAYITLEWYWCSLGRKSSVSLKMHPEGTSAKERLLTRGTVEKPILGVRSNMVCDTLFGRKFHQTMTTHEWFYLGVFVYNMLLQHIPPTEPLRTQGTLEPFFFGMIEEMSVQTVFCAECLPTYGACEWGFFMVNPPVV